MKRLYGLIADHEDWLLNRILNNAKERGYIKDAGPSLGGAWRMSVSGLSGLLLSAILKDNGIPETGPEEDYTQEPIASFVVSEVQRHREHGVTLGMFLGFFKCQRQCYKELISQSGFEPDCERRALLFIERIFDSIEIYLCVEWVKVSERTAVEGVKIYQEQLRSLTIKLTLVEQEERRRIASYVHDHIGQCLSIAKLELDKLSESLTEIYLTEAIIDINKLIEKTIQCARTLTFEISTPIFYEMGFEAGVKWLGEDLLGKRGVNLAFKCDEQPIQMDEEISVILFTAVRELFVNIVKHAKADRVSITIQKQNENIHVLVCDNGKGFVVSKKHNGSGRSNRFGLFCISERLEHLGGTLKIESEHGKGTRAALVAPLKL